MGQGDIIELLKKEKKKLTTREIARKLGVGYSCTIVKLRKLRDLGEIKHKKKGNAYAYKLVTKK